GSLADEPKYPEPFVESVRHKSYEWSVLQVWLSTPLRIVACARGEIAPDNKTGAMRVVQVKNVQIDVRRDVSPPDAPAPGLRASTDCRARRAPREKRFPSGQGKLPGSSTRECERVPWHPSPHAAPGFQPAQCSPVP